MPSLAFMTACDKVIVDQDGSASLINTFCGLAISSIEGKIPEDAIGPKSWTIIAMWRSEPSDQGKTFIQKTRVVDPAGKEFGLNTESFKFGTYSHSIRVSINGMPVGIPGDIGITVYLESEGKRVTDIHTYKVNISHRAAGK
jgi:hypothetical protein